MIAFFEEALDSEGWVIEDRVLNQLPQLFGEYGETILFKLSTHTDNVLRSSLKRSRQTKVPTRGSKWSRSLNVVDSDELKLSASSVAQSRA